MRVIILIATLSIAALAFAVGSAAFASGVGDVEIRLNGCANMAFVGLPNTVEIWIKNDANLDSMNLAFEFDIGRNFIFNPAYGSHGYVNEEGDAVGVWNMNGLGVDPYIDNINPDQILLYGSSYSGGLPIHATHSLCYTMQVAILPGELPLADGFCVDNVYIPPYGEWYFVDPATWYPPDFQGNANTATDIPDAPPVCFDIVDPCWADGDVDNDGAALTTGDYIKLIRYVQDCSYTPPVLYKCDLYGDGVIDQLDIDIYANYFQVGMGAFICGYPVPTRCDCCGYPQITGFSPAMNALGVSKSATVMAAFDREIVPSSIGNINVFEVKGQQSGKKSGSFSFSGPPLNQVTFDPTTDFFKGEVVDVRIAAGVESVCGAVSPCYHKWQFTVSNTKGNGSFAPGVMNYCGGNVSSMVAADFNGDGFLDLATVFEDSDSMSCVFNNGNGQLSLSRGVYPVEFKGSSTGKPAGIVACDGDKDNDIDVVVIRGGDDIDSSSFVFMENDGAGAFTSTAYQLLGVDGLSHSTPSMITGDFSGDSHPDLVMAIGDYAPDSAALLYFENNGEGVFSAKTRGVYPVEFKGSSTGKPAGLVSGDWDNDSRLDVCMFLDNYDVDSVALCLFGDSDNDGQVNELDILPFAYSGSSNGVPACVSANIDGDGDNDIVVTINSATADSATIIAFANEGVRSVDFQEVYRRRLAYNGASSGKPACVTADVDADDDMDFINHFGSTDSIWVFENNGTGQFEVKRGVYPVEFKGSSTGKPAGLVAGDFDGNGSADIAVTYTDTDYVAIMFGERDCSCVTAPDSMVAWFPFDETVGPTANNAAAGNDGTHYNSPTIEPGKVQNSLCFDGLDAHVDVPNYPAIEIGTNDFSIDAWVKRSPDDNDDIRIVVDKRADGAGDYVGYSLYLYQGKLGLQLSTPTQSHQNWVSNAYVAKDQWHHVAVTVDRDDPTGIDFYLDGSPVLPEYDPTSRDGSLANSFPMRVSSRSYEESGIFYGCIDEVEVFNRALEPQEIFDIWWAGECGKCKYITGDADASGDVDIDDVVYLINFIFVSGPEPVPYESGDADCSHNVDIDDVVYLINYIFSGGPPPGDPDGDGTPDC